MADTVTREVQVTAARARWRAHLLQLHAAELARIAGPDDSPTAAGLKADAEAKEAAATVHLDHAEAAERFSAAKQAHFADPKNEAVYADYLVAQQAMVDLRMYWRFIGEVSGSRRGYIQPVDNFEEPTDEDVLATHGPNGTALAGKDS